jgi:dTDP-4-amino-4,6-dideoxygalactose transaminase
MKDDALCEQAREIINFGITGPESIESLGINAKMNEIQAAIGLALLEDMDDVLSRRESLAAIYDKQFKGRLKVQQWTPGVSRNNGYYPVLFEDEQTLLKVQKVLNGKGIYPRRYFKPSLDEINGLAKLNKTMRASYQIAKRILCLPLFAELEEKECRDVAEIVMGIVEGS